MILNFSFSTLWKSKSKIKYRLSNMCILKKKKKISNRIRTHDLQTTIYPYFFFRLAHHHHHGIPMPPPSVMLSMPPPTVNMTHATSPGSHVMTTHAPQHITPHSNHMHIQHVVHHHSPWVLEILRQIDFENIFKCLWTSLKKLFVAEFQDLLMATKRFIM